jgi:hypothetical protein
MTISISNGGRQGQPDNLRYRLDCCLACGASITQRRFGRPRMWCSDRCRKSTVWWVEYLSIAGFKKSFGVVHHPLDRTPCGSCLACGKRFSRSGARPRLYCNEKCRSHFRAAKVQFQALVRRRIESSREDLMIGLKAAGLETASKDS